MVQYLRFGDDRTSIGTIVAGALNALFFRVSPVDASIEHVECKTVRPREIMLNDDVSILAVHACHLNTRIRAPISPENETAGEDYLKKGLPFSNSPQLRINGNGARFLQTVFDECLAVLFVVE